MTTAPVDELAQALRGTEQLVDAVRDEQWTRTTPCTDWKVRDLVNHLVGGNRLFAGILRGGQPPPLTDLPRLQGIDHLGDDPVAAYREAADALLAAFRQPGVLEQVFSVPVGPFLASPRCICASSRHSCTTGASLARPANPRRALTTSPRGC